MFSFSNNRSQESKSVAQWKPQLWANTIFVLYLSKWQGAKGLDHALAYRHKNPRNIFQHVRKTDERNPWWENPSRYGREWRGRGKDFGSLWEVSSNKGQHTKLTNYTFWAKAKACLYQNDDFRPLSLLCSDSKQLTHNIHFHPNSRHPILMCNKIITRLLHIQIQAPLLFVVVVVVLKHIKVVCFSQHHSWLADCLFVIKMALCFVWVYDQSCCILQTLHVWMLKRLLDETYMVRLNSIHTVVQAVRTAWGCYRVKRQRLYHVKSVHILIKKTSIVTSDEY